MSELKAVHAFDVYEAYTKTGDDEAAQVYLKSEADKVIAELEMKLASVQQVLRLNKPEALYSDLETMGRLNHEIDVVARRERHHKYKRCLAMAKWCHDKWIMSLGWDPTDGHTADFYLHYEKWEKRWLELAEKFKPNSTAQQGKGKQTMINAQENANADMSMSKRIRDIPLTNSDVICELAEESREVSWKLERLNKAIERLNKAIEANPEAVSAHHKELWRKQAKAMQEYVDVLGERIKDLIDNG